MPSADKNVEQLELSYLADGRENQYIHLGESLAGPTKTKHT